MMGGCCVALVQAVVQTPGAAPTHLEDLDHHLLIVGDVDGLKHFTVLASAQFTDQLVVFLVAIVTDRETV